MKTIFRFTIPAAIMTAGLFTTLCHSEVISPSATNKTEAALDLSRPQYTLLADCKDKTQHDNAAFTELDCKPLGEYQVNITAQSPQYFTIHLTRGVYKVSSDFTKLSNENPVETGKAIEWHLVNNRPRYMIFRLSWGTAEEPFKMRQFLVVNLVTDKDICALATVDVKNNKNANVKARDLILNEYKQTSLCPVSVEAF